MSKKRKGLIEDSYQLRISLLKNSKHSLLLSRHEESLTLNYELSEGVLHIAYNGNEQHIDIEERPVLNEATTRLFQCECGRHCKILYLPHGSEKSEKFGCRFCQNLTYSSTRSSDSTKNGAILNNYCRMLKIMEKRENIRTIFYRGAFTQRFSKLLADGTKCGLHGWVAEQMESIEKIKQMDAVLREARGGK